jgi:hypothetical protein
MQIIVRAECPPSRKKRGKGGATPILIIYGKGGPAPPSLLASLATPDECVRGYTKHVASGGPPIDAGSRFVLICAYTGKEVV